MKEKLRHLFFDLDHTLWDFETNSKETMAELFEEHRLHQFELFDFAAFMDVYTQVNRGLWDQYNRGELSKEKLRERRFRETFEKLGLENRHYPEDFSDNYISRCTEKPAVFPHVHEVLSSLSQRYSMSIITNGFPESQHRKMKASNLHGYFDHLVISEEVGFAKPHSGIFEIALSRAKVAKHEVIMIGDNLYADIEGAQKAGIGSIWFNPHKEEKPDPGIQEIHVLKELLALL
ncbi:MAG: YjjG family noncanonical pyrimidine nucleotidase [Bacteroidia bacterium]